MAELRHGTSSAYNQGCRCEVCVAGKRERDRAYYLRNQEKVKARANGYYVENREAVRAQSKDYRERNAEAIKTHKREAYAADPEPTKQRSKEWQAANPQRVRASAAKRRDADREGFRAKKRAEYHKAMESNPEKVRARRRAWAKTEKGVISYRFARHVRRGVKPDALAREWAAILLRDPCSYCAEPAIELDHIDPVTRDGSGTWENLTAACRTCNARKNDRQLLAFVAA